MALFNEILQGRQQNLLTKFFAMVGGSPAPVLSPEIQPGLDVLNLEHDTAVLQGVRWCMATQGVAAGGAGAYTKIGLRNGSGSTAVPLSLIMVRRIVVASTTAGLIYVTRPTSPSALSVSTQKKHQDYRLNPNDPLSWPPHDLLYGTPATAVSGPDVMFGVRVPANNSFDIPCHVVLPPINAASNCLYVEKSNANEDLLVSFEYYYREITPSELTL